MDASPAPSPWLLGIEIGGTKLQVGLGTGDGTLVDLERATIDPSRGAAGILRQIPELAGRLLRRAGATTADLVGVGIGFGGPVDADRGVVILSNQIAGWANYPLAAWARETFGVASVAVENDAATAALGEARRGAGAGFDPVLYVTIGSGIGGGLVVGGAIYRGTGRGAIEIGYLILPDPAPLGGSPSWETLENVASGWSIAWAGQKLAATSAGVDPVAPGPLLRLADGDPARITAELVARAAAEGDEGAGQILDRARVALAQGLAHAITLLAPQRVILGGGVSLIGEEQWLGPIRRAVEPRVFSPLRRTYEIVPAALGEAVVIHGALALASDAADRYSPPSRS